MGTRRTERGGRDARPRAKRTEARTLTPLQARQLLTSLSGHRLETLYVTMLGLGLRRGEALGLAWADVALDRGVLLIRYALKREGGTLVLGEVKTAKSRRSLNIPRPVVESLKAHRACQAQERLAVGEAWTDLGLVFTTQVGTPLDPRNIYRDFVGVCERSDSADGTHMSSATRRHRSCWRKASPSKWSPTFSVTRPFA
jgi:integrase